MFAIAALPGSPAPQLIDIAAPRAPDEGEVLCETLELGVCGTDREILHSLRPHVPVGERRLVLGHECLARVVETGSRVTDIRAGDYVVPLVRRAYDRSSRLARERADLLAFGNFVERGIYLADGFSPRYWLDRPEYLLPVAPSLAPVAVFAEPLSVCEKGINEATIVTTARAGEEHWTATAPRVLVTGLGPIAFAGAIAAIARGWPVTVSGRDADDTFRADLMRRFGAAYTCDADALFSPHDVERDGFDLLLECTGSDELMVAASGAVRSLGVIVWLGSTRVPEAKPLNVARMMRDGILRNHLHVGTVNSALRDFRDALAHLAQLQTTHAAELAALFTARVPMEEALWHYEQREPQGIKTVISH
jgi:threonine dehydrogenase-like Zn-dependent dehydrogenase